jgi:hypothetical protein
MARKNQCHGTTQKGTRCRKNIAKGNRRYCKQHSAGGSSKRKQVPAEEIQEAASSNIKIQERVRDLPINIRIRPKQQVLPWSQRTSEEQWRIPASPNMRKRAIALKAKVDQRMREQGWRHPYNWRRNPRWRNPYRYGWY